MSNNKQSSSIEWIIKQLIFKTEFEDLPNQYVLMSDKDISSIIEQGKAMHKEEITKAFDEGQEYEYQYHINSTPKFDSETYYNETFGDESNN
tara:strand:+ start:264 stop:539 length:276 start_codon:yes stop_codon:yes gene_type:complete